MATLAIAGLGAVLGGAAAGAVGASVMTGVMLGWTIGAFVGQMLFAETMRTESEGPRLHDIAIQSSTYGKPIPIVFGSMRIAGNIIWADKMKEKKHEETESSGGGKGGGGGSSHTTISYTYSISFAVGICEGPIIGIRRIWADGKLIVDNSDFDLSASSDRSKNVKIYSGTQDQEPDPLMSSISDNVPAYPGLAYAVFENLQLQDFGNRIPNLEFEIATNFETYSPTIGAYVA